VFSLPQPFRHEARARLWRGMEERRRLGKTADLAALHEIWRGIEAHLSSAGLATARREAQAA